MNAERRVHITGFERRKLEKAVIDAYRSAVETPDADRSPLREIQPVSV
jgi:hypothetical protein